MPVLALGKLSSPVPSIPITSSSIRLPVKLSSVALERNAWLFKPFQVVAHNELSSLIAVKRLVFPMYRYATLRHLAHELRLIMGHRRIQNGLSILPAISGLPRHGPLRRCFLCLPTLLRRMISSVCT